MTKHRLTLSKKIWYTIVASIVITVIFSYLLSNLFYENLYVENLENSLLAEGNRLALDYEGGPLTQDLREKVEWFNSKTEYEVFVVGNPKELAACLPFEISHETLISEDERQLLLQGNTIQKMGYEERFNRNIMAVVIPLLDENRLEGIIYMYVPVAKISELTHDFAFIWLIAAILFLVISIYLGTVLVQKLTRPLRQIKEAADRVSAGDYSVRVLSFSDDEVGQLALAFNHMSSSIQKEDEKKKEFLANVSHELRTPLSYVSGYSEALQTGMVKNEKDKEKFLSLIHRESKRMERLVSDLLDLAKFESDEHQLKQMPLPLAQLVEDATEKYILPMQEKGIKLSLHLDPDIIILGDEGRIEQVIQNVTDNALHYTDKGEISIVLKRSSEGCILSIQDTGIGIPEKDLSHIKERFYRVNKARTRQDGGSGLGLAISEKIVTLHGGKLELSSKHGEGTKVDIMFPIMEES
jgi:signal transduction histidine kinase